MSDFVVLIIKALGQVWETFLPNWPFLLVSALIAAGDEVVSEPGSDRGLPAPSSGPGGVLAATAVAVATPLCSCGTTAVILGTLAGSLPWAPIIVFMVASPLTSPEGLIYSAGLFGWPFALAFFGASILLGLGGGGVAHLLDRRGRLAGQARHRPAATGSRQPAAPPFCRTYPALPSTFAPAGGRQLAADTGGSGCAVSTSAPIAATLAPAYVPSVQHDSAPATCGCAASPAAAPDPQPGRAGLASLRSRTCSFPAGNSWAFFFAFAFIGYLLNDLIPATWIPMLFGRVLWL